VDGLVRRGISAVPIAGDWERRYADAVTAVAARLGDGR